jgi:hypothetical protein
MFIIIIINILNALYLMSFAAPVWEGNALYLQMSIFQNPVPPATVVCFKDNEGNVKDYVATSYL